MLLAELSSSSTIGGALSCPYSLNDRGLYIQERAFRAIGASSSWPSPYKKWGTCPRSKIMIPHKVSHGNSTLVRYYCHDEVTHETKREQLTFFQACVFFFESLLFALKNGYSISKLFHGFLGSNSGSPFRVNLALKNLSFIALFIKLFP